MTIAEIAAALGLSERTVERDDAAIDEKFCAGGLGAADLTLAEQKILSTVIAAILRERVGSPAGRSSVGNAQRVVSAVSTGAERRAVHALPRPAVPRRFGAKK